MARENPKTRKAQILAAAYNIAKEQGLEAVTQTAVGRRMGVARTLIINYYYYDDLINAVVDLAIKQKDLPIIGEAILKGNGEALKLPDDIREDAVKSLV